MVALLPVASVAAVIFTKPTNAVLATTPIPIRLPSLVVGAFGSSRYDRDRPSTRGPISERDRSRLIMRVEGHPESPGSGLRRAEKGADRHHQPTGILAMNWPWTPQVVVVRSGPASTTRVGRNVTHELARWF